MKRKIAYLSIIGLFGVVGLAFISRQAFPKPVVQTTPNLLCSDTVSARDNSNWTAFQRLRLEVMLASDYNGTRARHLFKKALMERDDGNWSRAESLWKKAIQASPDMTVSALYLGHLLKDEGRLSEAEPFLKQAMDINIKRFGADSFEASTPMRLLADLYEQESKFLQAERLLKNIIRICKKLPERDEAALQSAYAVNALARVYIAEGHPELLTPTMREPGTVYKKLLDKNIGNAPQMVLF